MGEPSHIHYGSLEQGERERLSKLEEQTKKQLEKLKDKSAIQAKAAEPETQELSASSQAAVQRQQELKETIAKRKRARELAVPTNDNSVKLKLRDFGEAICLFGEQAPERRERLRDVMAARMDLDENGDGRSVFAPAEPAKKAYLEHRRKVTHRALPRTTR